MFRGVAVTIASALWLPTLTDTVYLPCSSATNSPSSPISATPVFPMAATDHRAVTPVSGLPAGSLAVKPKRTTSPVRTLVAPGVMVRERTGPASGRDGNHSRVAGAEAHRVIPHIAVGAVRGAGQGEAGPGDDLGGARSDLHPVGRRGSHPDPGLFHHPLARCQRHGGDGDVALESGADQTGRVHAALASAEPEDSHAGDRVARGVERPSGELQGLPHLDFRLGRGDLDPGDL